MGDPLSVTASIIAALQLTASAVKAINEIKDASKDCSLILLELNHTNGILMMLNDSVESAKDEPTWLTTIEALAVPDGPLALFKTTLERLLSRVEPVRGLRKAGRALIWPFKKQEVKDILDSIERQKLLFTLAFQNDSLLVLPIVIPPQYVSPLTMSRALSRHIKSDVAKVKVVVDHLAKISLGNYSDSPSP